MPETKKSRPPLLVEDVYMLNVMQTLDIHTSPDPTSSNTNVGTESTPESHSTVSTQATEDAFTLSSMVLDDFPLQHNNALFTDATAQPAPVHSPPQRAPEQPPSIVSSSMSLNLSSPPMSTSNLSSPTSMALDSPIVPPPIPLIPSYPHLKTAKLLASRNIKNSTEFFLDSGIASAAEGESPPAWFWDAYRRASIAAVDSLRQEQKNQQRLLIEQQLQIELMKQQLLQERMLNQQNRHTSGSTQEYSLGWSTPPLSAPGLELPTTFPTSPALASSHGTMSGKRSDSLFIGHDVITRSRSHGKSTSGSKKGSGSIARSKSAMGRSSGRRLSISSDRSRAGTRASSPRNGFLAATSFDHASHLNLLKGTMNTGDSSLDHQPVASTSSASASSLSMSLSSQILLGSDSLLANMDLSTLLSADFLESGYDLGHHLELDQDHSSSASDSGGSRSPSPSASPSLSPRTTSASLDIRGNHDNNNSSNTHPNHQNHSSAQITTLKCPYHNCTKSFTKTFNLTAHLKTHETPKPFPCHLCTRVFSRKHDLQRHIRVHTGSKPYVCLNPACQKAFARTDALCRHYKVEEQCRHAVIQIQKTENESREHEQVLTKTGQSGTVLTSSGNGIASGGGSGGSQGGQVGRDDIVSATSSSFAPPSTTAESIDKTQETSSGRWQEFLIRQLMHQEALVQAQTQAQVQVQVQNSLQQQQHQLPVQDESMPLSLSLSRSHQEQQAPRPTPQQHQDLDKVFHNA
ncbi:hypothetical protein BGZ94_006736 [Podila epigama]|nr:hypothetical protein BGZ94_006736 [Podila epigama]